MNEQEQRIKELETIVVELYKRLWKLENPNSSRMANDSSWLRDLKRDASKIKI